MPRLKLTVLSLRYSSWSMRPWICLTHAGAVFDTHTVKLPHMQRREDSSGGSENRTKVESTPLQERRKLGSVHGLFPVLHVDEISIHESLAICEYVAEAYPDAYLWPQDILERARARAISCEMVSGFATLRNELPCHLFGRIPAFSPTAGTQADISRIFEIWSECLERSGGPFLFGRFCIADAIYFPVLTRFRTYGIPLADSVADYAQAVEALPAVEALISRARTEPRIPLYDGYLSGLGGDPVAAL